MIYGLNRYEIGFRGFLPELDWYRVCGWKSNHISRCFSRRSSFSTWMCSETLENCFLWRKLFVLPLQISGYLFLYCENSSRTEKQKRNFWRNRKNAFSCTFIWFASSGREALHKQIYQRNNFKYCEHIQELLWIKYLPCFESYESKRIRLHSQWFWLSCIDQRISMQWMMKTNAIRPGYLRTNLYKMMAFLET